MQTLTANQKQVLEYINKNSDQSFNATQIGVAVGKRIPKQAAAWSGPILKKLVELQEIIKQDDNGKALYRAVTLKFNNKKADKAPAVKVTQEDIDNAKEATEYADELIAIINKSGKLEGIEDKAAYKEALATEINTAFEKYEKKNGEIPGNHVSEVSKLVKAALKFTKAKAETAPREPRVNIFTGVDFDEALKVAKTAIKENAEAEEPVKEPALVRDTILDFLATEYGFNETSLEDKRTRAFIWKVKNELGLTNRSEETVMATEEAFEKGDKVKFRGGRLTATPGELIKAVVVRTFNNDFGFRYVVAKDANGKNYTKRDKDVTKY